MIFFFLNSFLVDGIFNPPRLAVIFCKNTFFFLIFSIAKDEGKEEAAQYFSDAGAVEVFAAAELVPRCCRSTVESAGRGSFFLLFLANNSFLA